jgi:hypothetical protein
MTIMRLWDEDAAHAEVLVRIQHDLGKARGTSRSVIGVG